MARTITAAAAQSIAASWVSGPGSTSLPGLHALALHGRLDDEEVPRAFAEAERLLDGDLTSRQEIGLCKLRRWLRAEGRTRGLL